MQEERLCHGQHRSSGSIRAHTPLFCKTVAKLHADFLALKDEVMKAVQLLMSAQPCNEGACAAR